MHIYKLYDGVGTDDVYEITIGPFVDETDGKTRETGLAASLDVYIHKVWDGTTDNPTWTARASTTAPTHSAVVDGWYNVLFDKAEFTIGTHIIYAEAPGALPVWMHVTIMYGSAVDALLGENLHTVYVSDDDGGDLPMGELLPLLEDANALTNLLNFFTATGYDAAASAIGSVSDEVNVGSIDGSATAAANLKAFFDGTGYNAANSAVGTVGAVTGAATANVTQLGGSATALAKLAALLAGAVTGSAVTGTLSTTEMTTNLTETTDNHWKAPNVVKWITGNLAGQARAVTGYVGATKKLQYAATTEAPANGDQFIIL